MDRSIEAVTDSPVTIVVSTKDDPFVLPLGASGGIRSLALDLRTGFHRGLWALQLDKAVGEGRERVVFAAHGIACLAVAWWAQLSPRSYLRNVAGAVFHAPMAMTMGQAAIARSLWPSPATRLPFPTVVANEGSPLVDRVLALADNWGSRFVDMDAIAHPTRSDLRGERTGIEDHLLDLLGLFRRGERPATALGDRPALAALACPAR